VLRGGNPIAGNDRSNRVYELTVRK
jgi:hypothetical protein